MDEIKLKENFISALETRANPFPPTRATEKLP